MDKVDEVNPKKRGRPKKVDQPTALGQYQVEQAKQWRESKKEDHIVEKYYELYHGKLLLCKKVKSGTVYKEFVGRVDDKNKARKKQLDDQIKRLQAEGRLRIKV